MPVLLHLLLLLQSAAPRSGAPAGDDARDWARESANVAAAWARGARATVPVAVIDTGILLEHPDLVLWRNPGEVPANGLDDDGNGYVDDLHGWDFVEDDGVPQDVDGHGTACAGLIGGTVRLERHAAGVAPGCELMALRVFARRGEPATAEVVAAAIEYAIRAGARVINCSWGGPEAYPELERALALAGEAGALLVVPAGNGGPDHLPDDLGRHPFYPACYPDENLLCVTALELPTLSPSGRLRPASYASYGRLDVDLAAPGSPVWSTSLARSGYAWGDGTSLAAAFTSGAAALIWEEAGGSPSGVRACLVAGTHRLAALESLCVSGGTLDLGAACAPR